LEKKTQKGWHLDGSEPKNTSFNAMNSHVLSLEGGMSENARTEKRKTIDWNNGTLSGGTGTTCTGYNTLGRDGGRRKKGKGGKKSKVKKGEGEKIFKVTKQTEVKKREVSKEEAEYFCRKTKVPKEKTGGKIQKVLEKKPDREKIFTSILPVGREAKQSTRRSGGMRRVWGRAVGGGI